MITHTPGPWEVRGSKERQLFAVYPVGGAERVADVYCPLDIAEGKLTIDGSLTGNLALIAAAPDLLALIKRINTAFYVDGTAKALRPVMAETKEMIRLAEGR